METGMTASLAGVTHEVTIDVERGVVTKRYRSWNRGEPVREWRALSLLATCAPGLAAEPISASLDADPPVISMSRLPGEPLGATPLEPAQAHALAQALDRLWRSVPAERHRDNGPATANPAAFTRQVRRTVAAHPEPGDDPQVRRARAAAIAWLDDAGLDAQAGTGHEVILGQGDSNLANFLWDGGQVRLVDFEDSGPSDRAFELAILVEHISAWVNNALDAPAFLAEFELTRAERARLREFRRLAALFWLTLLRPGSAASGRNPPGTARRQAERLLTLLG
jgi:Ser/Thr protein kinase RdoA (MazF antagonist)